MVRKNSDVTVHVRINWATVTLVQFLNFCLLLWTIIDIVERIGAFSLTHISHLHDLQNFYMRWSL